MSDKKEVARFDGETLTIAQATISAVNRYLRDITLFIKMLSWSSNYRTRQKIRMSDVEFADYTQNMSREVSTLAIDAVLIEAFLMMQDDKASRRGIIERWLTRKRVPFVKQWERFSSAMRRKIVIKRDWHNNEVPAVQEGKVEIDERQHGDQVAEASEREELHGEPERQVSAPSSADGSRA